MPDEDKSNFSKLENGVAIFNFFLAVSVVLINSSILTSMLTNWKAIQRQTKNKASVLLTINLCTADLIMGIFDFYYCLPVYMDDIKKYMGQHKILCITSFSLVTTTNMASGYSLVAIAIERYMYVVHALRYFQIMNTRRVVLMIITVWLVAIAGALPVYFWNDWSNDTTFCDDFIIEPVKYVIVFGICRVVLVMITITILHWRIHRAAQKLQRRMELVPTGNSRSGRTVFIIACIYIISWMPSSITYLCLKFGVDVQPAIYNLTICIIDVNYIANPFIYAYNNRGIRMAVVNSFKRFSIKCTYNCYRRFTFHRLKGRGSGMRASQETNLSTLHM